MGKKQQVNPVITGLSDDYQMSQNDVAEKMFLHKNTIGCIERRAIEKFKRELSRRGLTLDDLLEV